MGYTVSHVSPVATVGRPDPPLLALASFFPDAFSMGLGLR